MELRMVIHIIINDDIVNTKHLSQSCSISGEKACRRFRAFLRFDRRVYALRYISLDEGFSLYE